MPELMKNRKPPTPSAANVAKQTGAKAPPKRELTPDEIAEAKESFKKFDLDKSGTIDRNELIIILEQTQKSKNMGKAIFDRLVNMHMNTVDKDGNGVIDEKEYLELYKLIFTSEEAQQQQANTAPVAAALVAPSSPDPQRQRSASWVRCFLAFAVFL